MTRHVERDRVVDNDDRVAAGQLIGLSGIQRRIRQVLAISTIEVRRDSVQQPAALVAQYAVAPLVRCGSVLPGRQRRPGGSLWRSR